MQCLCGAAPISPLPRDSGIWGQVPGGHFLCASIIFESHLVGIGRPPLTKPTVTPEAYQGDLHGNPKCLKMFQWLPAGMRKEPKVGHREKKDVERHDKFKKCIFLENNIPGLKADFSKKTNNR